MSDFDAALERLVNDPSFAASLTADPAAALAGYHLQPEEIELLSAQVATDAGGHRAVEERTSKASMFGLLAPLAGAAGIGSAIPGTQSGLGPADLQAGSAHTGFGQAGGFGQAIGEAGTVGFGGPGDPIGQGIGPSGAVSGMGEQLTGGGALGNTLSGDPEHLIGQHLSDVGAGGADGTAGFGQADPPPTDYHTRVDVNGDGRWDAHTYVQRADGGVDIVADMNHDGRPDWVAHDYDRDGLVDSADYDKNRDGVFETHFFDDDGDGWLDRKIVSPEPKPPTH